MDYELAERFAIAFAWSVGWEGDDWDRENNKTTFYLIRHNLRERKYAFYLNTEDSGPVGYVTEDDLITFIRSKLLETKNN